MAQAWWDMQMLFVEQQISAGSCLYAPALVTSSNEGFKKRNLTPKTQLYAQKLRKKTTKKIIAAMDNDNFTDSIITVNLENKIDSDLHDQNYWLRTLRRYWKDVQKIKFVLYNNTYVIASTMICSKQTPGNKDFIQEVCAENFKTYYLCIECLLYSTGEFLFEINSGRVSHRETTHALLTLDDTLMNRDNTIENIFKIKHLKPQAKLRETIIDEPVNPPTLLLARPGPKCEHVIFLTLSQYCGKTFIADPIIPIKIHPTKRPSPLSTITTFTDLDIARAIASTSGTQFASTGGKENQNLEDNYQLMQSNGFKRKRLEETPSSSSTQQNSHPITNWHFSTIQTSGPSATTIHSRLNNSSAVTSHSFVPSTTTQSRLPSPIAAQNCVPITTSLSSTLSLQTSLSSARTQQPILPLSSTRTQQPILPLPSARAQQPILQLPSTRTQQSTYPIPSTITSQTCLPSTITSQTCLPSTITSQTCLPSTITSQTCLPSTISLQTSLPSVRTLQPSMLLSSTITGLHSTTSQTSLPSATSLSNLPFTTQNATFIPPPPLTSLQAMMNKQTIPNSCIQISTKANENRQLKTNVGTNSRKPKVYCNPELEQQSSSHSVVERHLSPPIQQQQIEREPEDNPIRSPSPTVEEIYWEANVGTNRRKQKVYSNTEPPEEQSSSYSFVERHLSPPIQQQQIEREPEDNPIRSPSPTVEEIYFSSPASTNKLTEPSQPPVSSQCNTNTHMQTNSNTSENLPLRKRVTFCLELSEDDSSRDSIDENQVPSMPSFQEHPIKMETLPPISENNLPLPPKIEELQYISEIAKSLIVTSMKFTIQSVNYSIQIPIGDPTFFCKCLMHNIETVESRSNGDQLTEYVMDFDRYPSIICHSCISVPDLLEIIERLVNLVDNHSGDFPISLPGQTADDVLDALLGT